MYEMNDKEKTTDIVFGDTFAMYDEAEFDKFIEPLYIRLKNNGIPESIFKGKKCLDAGCGGGRGSILMAQCGAKEVIGVDFSATNVKSCEMRAIQKGFTNLSFQEQSLTDLPFEDESFDIVWCNGVLMHTVDPDKCLQEITRVLKPGGHMWLYVYGAGGIYWHVIDWIRGVLKDVDVRECIYQLRMMDVPVRRTAEVIDDWFSGYLRTYTDADVSSRLKGLGFADTHRLLLGTNYDTSQRKFGADQTERELMGEGDLRYFCTKLYEPLPLSNRLPQSGSKYTDGDSVLQFAPLLSELKENITRLEINKDHEITALKIIICRSLHNKVRTLLETDGVFNTSELKNHIEFLSNKVDSMSLL